MNFDQFPYIANIAILLPIAISTLTRWFPTDQRAFAESEGWRKIAGSMWLAILLLSVCGIFYPLQFSAILVMQIIYKSTWLVSYMLPKIFKKQLDQIPWGMSTTFILVVFVYPIFIPWSYLFAAPL